MIFDTNPKLGYYTVGNDRFHSKPLALIEGTRRNIHPEWHFNKDAFGKFDWTVEPPETIRELYRKRAQQLRDKYDYLKLEFSGGGDSVTVLYSFINNGIHLDEVIFRHPKAAEKNVSADPYNTKPENSLSEWEYAAKPVLQKLAIEHPEIKITFHDYTEGLVKNPATDESWVFRTREYFQPGWIYKHDFRALDHHLKVLDSGKTFCTIYGIDKPKLCVKDGQWYLYFLDIQANTANPEAGEYVGQINNEYFFWTPDMPEILCKQSHMIRKWFSLPANRHLQFLIRWPNYNWGQRTTYEQIIRPLIYEDFNPTTFQVSKPTNNFYCEMDHWFYVNCQETAFYKTWKAGLQYLVNNIDKKYFNYELGQPVGLIGFLGEFYRIGPALESEFRQWN
jgi:hypothetical protein